METYIKDKENRVFLMKKDGYVVCVQIFEGYAYYINAQKGNQYFDEEFEVEMIPCDKTEFLEAYDKATEFIKNKII